MRHVKHVRFLLLIMTFLFVVLLGILFDLTSYLNPTRLSGVVESYGIWAPVAFILIKVAVISLFLPGIPLTIASGAIFGPLYGTIYSVLGGTLGASVLFLLARYGGREWFESWSQKRSKWLSRYLNKTRKHGFWITFVLRIVQVIPFALLNVALGLSRVRFIDYFFATLLSLIPSAIVYVYFGTTIVSRDLQPISLAVVFVFLLWLFGLGLGQYLKLLFKQKKRK